MPDCHESFQPRTIIAAGDRVCLRTPCMEDADEFLRVVNESRDFHAPWISPPATTDQFVEFIDRIGTPGFVPFLVCALPEGHIVGAINLSNICYRNFCSACAGYWVGVRHQGKGLMTDGMTVMLTHAFSTMQLHRVEANVQPGNTQSKRLLARLRFRHEGFSPRFVRIGGTWKDHERWAICSEDFAPEQPG